MFHVCQQHYLKFLLPVIFFASFSMRQCMVFHNALYHIFIIQISRRQCKNLVTNLGMLLLLLLSRFSRVRLCATPGTAAHQAPPSLGFSRQEHWSGCHFLLQCMKVKSESEVAQSCLTLSDPMDCSLPGSSVHGIFQARVLEWGAIGIISPKWL